LQATVNMRDAGCLRMNTEQAEKLSLSAGSKVHVKQGEGTAILPLLIDDHVPAGCVWVPSGLESVKNLSTLFGSVDVEKV